MFCADASACSVDVAEDVPVRLGREVPGRARVLIGSGCFGAGFDEGEPLVAEVGDDLQAAAEGFDVGGQGAQFGGARLGVLDGGHAALGDAHPGSDLGLGDAEAAAHLSEPGYTADMTDSARPENEPDAGNAASVLPPHLAALIGALNGPPDLARQHDKYLAYPDREEHGGVASA